MLENLYRDLCEDLEPGAQPDSTTLSVLGLEEAEARRLMQEVMDKREAAASAEAEKAAEAARAAQLQAALERAKEYNAMTTRTTAPPPPKPPAAPPSAAPPSSGPTQDTPPAPPSPPPPAPPADVVTETAGSVRCR